jgi:hypothetical protein
MKLSQHLEEVRKGLAAGALFKHTWVGLEQMAREVGFLCYQEMEIPGMFSVFSPHHSWICTDTGVGLRFYFLGNECVCASYQSARKSDEVFEWVSQEAFDKVKTLVLRLINQQNDQTPAFIDWDESIKPKTT